jgi:hypothetical protein
MLTEHDDVANAVHEVVPEAVKRQPVVSHVKGDPRLSRQVVHVYRMLFDENCRRTTAIGSG